MSAMMRVLLVSNEENLRKTLRKILEQDGFEVECAAGLTEEVLIAGIPWVNVMILDTDDDQEGCKEQIYRLMLAKLEIAVLVLAACLPCLDVNRLEQKGVFVRQKPMEPSAILSTVRKLLAYPLA